MEDIFGERLGPEAGEIGVPEGIFSHIVGYRDVKDHFKEALETESGLQSILLVGPPASSKTLFLRAVESAMRGAIRFSGGTCRRRGSRTT